MLLYYIIFGFQNCNRIKGKANTFFLHAIILSYVRTFLFERIQEYLLSTDCNLTT